MFRSIRWKVALGLALPIFVAFLGYSILHYYHEKSILLENIELSAVQLGELARSGLRHAMLNNDQTMLQNGLVDIGNQQNILRIAIFDSNVQLKMTDQPADFDPAPTLSSPGCVECHQPKGVLQQYSIVLDTIDSKESFLRSSIPISNEPACHQCHDPAQKILGVIITDYSLVGSMDRINGYMWLDLFYSAFLTLGFTVIIYLIAHFLIVKRVEMLRAPLEQYALGDLSVRIPLNSNHDEIDDLIKAFNKTAEDLEEEIKIKEMMSDARYGAVLDERHRLARELHDSTAQILGYVRNKAYAVRMLIEQNKLPDAVSELRQLDEAAGAVFADLRQAILDLKTNIKKGQNISSILSEYVVNFERYSDIPTEVINEDMDQIRVPEGSDLQLLRIVQEALANIRKHAGATRAVVTLQVDEQKTLTVTIHDNGTGFDPAGDSSERKPHFGLEMMRERASAIGASFEILSEHGQGTQVIVKLQLAGKGES